MTIKCWITPLLSLFVICSVGEISLAQDIVPVDGMLYQQQGGMHQQQGGMYQRQAYQPTTPGQVFGNQGFNPPPNSAIDTSSFQSWMKPWPAISPFEHSYSESYWDGGLWKLIQGNEQRRFFGTAGIMTARFAQPKTTVVGATGVRSVSTTTGSANFDLFLNADLSLLEKEGINLGGVTPATVFERHKNESSPGIELMYGFVDPDKGGGNVAVFYITGTDQSWQRGTGDPTLPTFNAAISFNDEFGGSTIPLDTFAKISFESIAGGIEANLFNKPLYRNQSMKLQVRSTWGLRYMYIKEKFGFEGQYSGNDVTFDADGLGTIVAPPVAPFPFPAFNANLENQTTSHLLGPQAGFDYSMGGKSFKVSGFTKFGVLLNNEFSHLKERGLSSPFGLLDVNGNPTLNPNYDPNHRTSVSEKHSHLSPLIEQKVNVDLNVITLIPYVKSIKIFNNAKLRLGYKITGAWGISRPHKSIVWQGGALNPYISQKREFWYGEQFSASLIWER